MPTTPRAPTAPEPVPAAILGDRGVFTWQRALHVAGRDLPEPVRYTLVVLALYMNPDGTHGRPGYERFVAARGKSDRTIRTHLDQAISAGWLRCARRGGRAGDGTVRASVYIATIPAEVFGRLSEVLAPAWGECGLPQPEAQGLPVEDPEPEPEDHQQQPSQPEVHGLPDEPFSTGNLGASTGSFGASTGSAALPPTDHFHRPDTPISQSGDVRDRDHPPHRTDGLTDQTPGTPPPINHQARIAQTRAVLEGFGERGLTDFVVHRVIVEALRRAATTGKPLGIPVDRYISTWDRANVTEAVGVAYDAEDARNRPPVPDVDEAPRWTGEHRTARQAIAEATPDHQHTPQAAQRPAQPPDAPPGSNVTTMPSRLPECSHGHPGGAYPRPDGELYCGGCRTHKATCKRGPEACHRCQPIADAEHQLDAHGRKTA